LDGLLVGAYQADSDGKFSTVKSYIIFKKNRHQGLHLTKLSSNSKYDIGYLGDKNANTLTGSHNDEIFVTSTDNNILIKFVLCSTAISNTEISQGLK